MNFLDRIFLCG